jgi:hypothetical protein
VEHTATGRRRKLSVSIAEDLAAYAADRAEREARSVSDVVDEGIALLRRGELDARAAEAYAEDADEALEWAEAGLRLANDPDR